MTRDAKERQNERNAFACMRKVDEWGWNPTRKEWAATKRYAAEKNAAEERRKPRRIPVLRAGGGRRNSKRTECLRFKRKT